MVDSLFVMKLRERIPLMLEHRFGALSPQTRQTIAELPPEHIEIC